jgi:hypothetical protein
VCACMHVCVWVCISVYIVCVYQCVSVPVPVSERQTTCLVGTE